MNWKIALFCDTMIMSKFDVSYDPEADALYIKVKNWEYSYSKEEKDVLVDYDEKGNVLWMEILDASKKTSLISSLLIRNYDEVKTN